MSDGFFPSLIGIPQVIALLQQILANQAKILTNQATEIKSMSALSDAVTALTAEVTTVQGTEASALTLIKGIVAQLNAALADAADATAAVAAVKALTVQLQASDNPLAAAVAANQPPAPATSTQPKP